ncbi:acetyl-CoA carboxylase biotin carboxyl carrier protein subunit [Novipirellula artificiosorum]|uniref:Glutaconyl-CoA decarboxylase subunit gamma n=1 Tax=Novipirellula artificiosorum TaxID=2528016 RepID=A0A5C6DM77_9BACT|nr:biotin/lipoyl-containing protein [Novipirellula artificiosorum]TWU37244.1 Glutaconyl-CoA decarboxylase subunit gamma [Novipirellula artificiosorum]
MKKLRITIGDKAYDVTVETLESESSPQPWTNRPAGPAPSSAPPPAAVKAAPTAPKQTLSRGSITSPMAGVILSIDVEEGESVEDGQLLLVLEAMKMENQIIAPAAATVKSLLVAVGESVQDGQVLVELE